MGLWVILLLVWMVGVEAAPICPVSSSTTLADAIADCCNQGGGVVVVPAGTFDVQAPLTICSNLEIQLNELAIVFAPSTQQAYGNSPAFLFGRDLTNIKLTGRGMIDGNGAAWWDNDSTATNPHLIIFINCTNVEIRDIFIVNTPKYAIVPKDCNHVRITGVKIRNPYTDKSKNLDCIDPSGNDIYVADCNLQCGDDNVAIKGPSSNVLVENCYFGTGHGASVGSIANTTVRNVTFRNIELVGTDNGCRVKTRIGYKGGLVQDIMFDTINMDRVKYPIVIDGLYNSLAQADGNEATRIDVADIDGVTFRHIRSTNGMKNSFITCDADHPCKNIVLSDIADSVPITCSNAHGTAMPPLSPASLSACLT